MTNKLYILGLIGLLLTSCNLNRTCYRFNGVTMLPTIPEGSLVKITKDIDRLEYGDIILFEYEKEYFYNGTKHVKFNDPIICRIVGLPLDSLAIERDICIINGKKSPFRFTQKGDYQNEYESELPNGIRYNMYSFALTNPEYEEKGITNTPSIQVSADHYFVMGDNRSDVFDSRHLGSIPRSRIIGKVIKITPP